MKRKIKRTIRNIKFGVKNLIRFLPVIWKWRGWDYGYSYDLFLKALEFQAEDLGRFRNHTCWRKNAKEIDRQLALWEAYLSVVDWEDEEAAWNEFHEHLRDHARRWWY